MYLSCVQRASEHALERMEPPKRVNWYSVKEETRSHSLFGVSVKGARKANWPHNDRGCEDNGVRDKALSLLLRNFRRIPPIYSMVTPMSGFLEHDSDIYFLNFVRFSTATDRLRYGHAL